MPDRTHYEVLGVLPGSSADVIRQAYRGLAREHHPDLEALLPASGSDVDMSAVNEAYRVLRDEARRAMYDASLRKGSAVGPAAPVSEKFTSRQAATEDGQYPGEHRRARISWRLVLAAGVAVVVAGLVLTQFTETAGTPSPDGVLRVGDCVEVESDLDVHEVACTGDPELDLVVEVIVDFGETCPAPTEPHRDQLGLGIACVRVPD